MADLITPLRLGELDGEIAIGECRILDSTPRMLALTPQPTRVIRPIAGSASTATMPMIFHSIAMKSVRMSSMKTPVLMKMFQGAKAFT